MEAARLMASALSDMRDIESYDRLKAEAALGEWENALKPKEAALEASNAAFAPSRASLEARCKALEAALADLRESCTDAYKAGRIPAEPFVRAGNVLDKAKP